MGEIRIFSGRMPGGLKCVVYGPEGIGKTTFASHFPDPVFIDTEGSTKHMDVQRTERPQSWAELMSQVQFFTEHPDRCGTLVIDTADWAEQLCMDAVCRKYEKKGIEDFGYGKGYVYLREEFGKLLNLLESIAEKGINTVVTAHARMRKFEQPDELGAYDRWELKLDKNTAPLVKEWADMVLFANYKTVVVNVDGQGALKGKNKAQGGKRVMYTAHNPCWDAKNRQGLPEEMPFDYAGIAAVVPMGGGKVPAATKTESSQVLEAQPLPKAVPVQKREEAPKTEQGLPGIPEKLLRLMEADGVSETELRRAVSGKGYFPANMPVSKYPRDFVENALIATWDRVYAMVQDLRAQDAEAEAQAAKRIAEDPDCPF